MAHYLIFPEKDGSIYSRYPSLNTGMDEILEITKDAMTNRFEYMGEWKSTVHYSSTMYVIYNDIYYRAINANINNIPTGSVNWDIFEIENAFDISRILIQFNCDSIFSLIGTSSFESYLNLSTCISKNISSEFTINIYTISSSWSSGTGIFSLKKSNDGVSWQNRTEHVLWNNSGSDYLNTISSSQYFNMNLPDIHCNVSNIVYLWKSGSLVNNGFIIKRPNDQEFDFNNYGNISYYSTNTNTVYLPTLEFRFSDYVRTIPTASVSSSLLTEKIDIYIKDLSEKYFYGSVVRIDIGIRESNRRKSFIENINGNVIKYVNDNIYYSIRDSYTNREIIPFSNYTVVSLDNDGYYFNMIFNGMMTNRFYKIIFKYTKNGHIQYFDKNYIFKVIK